ncbi:NADPH cytochrome P450 oxidoreductase family protein [Dechloromonas sp. ZY10]|uniref:NADPH cytochrome P450 oxidoreductase family protein n=1 Tax=Dechloromonas aquae TaxID=2664436 RepID=UPI0035294890
MAFEYFSAALEAVPPLRLAAAGGVLLAWAALCRHAWRRGHPLLPAAGEWTVVYASQTGTAAALAEESAALLGAPPPLPLDLLPLERLAGGGRFLFIVATAGEGEAPDNGRRFGARLDAWCAATRSSAGQVPLAAARYALLALGDDRYPGFCAFGEQLDLALQAAGARPWQAMLRVNRSDEASLQHWFAGLGAFIAAPQLTRQALATTAWRLQQRDHLNPGSSGGEVYRLCFVPAADGGGSNWPIWQSGDLARIELPGWGAPRDYSIASLPTDGSLQLLVRRQVDRHGRPGLASNFLCSELPLNGCVDWQIRPHAPFHLADNAQRPLLLIGNGVGLAGLLAHLKAARAAGSAEQWLVYGERCPQADDHAGRLLPAGEGVRIDRVFSRCPQAPAYVQQRLREAAGELQDWVARGAAIYVCGSRRGMGDGVEQVLRNVLGEALLTQLAQAGRYRRDVF